MKINTDIKEEIFYKNKSISENKYLYKKFLTNYEKDNTIDTHYLLYSNLPLGTPQNIIDKYKLLKKRRQKTPDNRKIEYLRTYEDQFD